MASPRSPSTSPRWSISLSTPSKVRLPTLTCVKEAAQKYIHMKYMCLNFLLPSKLPPKTHLDKHLLVAKAEGHVHHSSHKWVVVFTKMSLKRNSSRITLYFVVLQKQSSNCWLSKNWPTWISSCIWCCNSDHVKRVDFVVKAPAWLLLVKVPELLLHVPHCVVGLVKRYVRFLMLFAENVRSNLNRNEIGR